MINRTDAERIASAVHAVRPDWPLASILTFIKRDLNAWPWLDLLVGLVYVAGEQNLDGTWTTHTPARVKEAGPWRALTNGNTQTYRSPKTGETCTTPGHSGWATNCGQCRSETIAEPIPTTEEP